MDQWSQFTSEAFKEVLLTDQNHINPKVAPSDLRC